VADVSVAEDIIAEDGEFDSSIVGRRVGAVPVINGIAGSNTVACGRTERVIAGSNLVEIDSHNLTYLVSPDVGKPHGGLPGDLLLIGGVPLIQTRVL